MSVLPTSQNKRRALFNIAMYVAVGLLVALAVASRMSGVSMHVPSTIVVIGIGVLAVLQFSALDEMAKQAHYLAWYWGGLIGLSVMAAFALANAATPRTFAFIESLMLQHAGKADTETAFLLGLAATPTLMMLGFFGWWAVYWLRRR